MDIRNVANHGPIERGSDRTGGAQQKREPTVLIPMRDEARISAGSRAVAGAVEGLAERARNADGDREAMVAAAIERLRSGALDSADAWRSSAERMLGQGFLAE
jgi:hypothetical protein